MSLLNTISVGQSALRTASEALGVVGHNTANAATEGYTRQEIVTSAADPYSRGGLWIGSGVTADDISRITNVFASERLTDARGEAAEAEISYQAHQIIESSMTAGNSVADSLTAFFDAMDELTADPSETGHRLAAIGAAETFTSSISTTMDQLDTIQDGLTEQLGSYGEGVNLSLERIAELNGLIGQGGSGDLADERDRLINGLADSLGVSADFSSADGQATVFLGGHALVMGDSHREIVFDTTGDTPVITVSADDATITVTDDVGGGTGGLISAWQTAEDIKDELDSFVVAFGGAFNDQHALGFDADGNAGGEFFTVSATDPAAGFSVNAALLADDSLLALADDPAAEVGDRGNLDALSALQDAEIVAGETPEGFMAGLYSQLGDTVRSAEVHYITEAGALADAEALRESISGVDLDEEAADLLEWQAAYQAAARVVTTSNELLSELMNIVR